MFAMILISSVLLSYVIDLSLFQAVMVNLFVMFVWFTGRRMKGE